jgi:hypothetical protein
MQGQEFHGFVYTKNKDVFIWDLAEPDFSRGDIAAVSNRLPGLPMAQPGLFSTQRDTRGAEPPGRREIFGETCLNSPGH